MCSWMQAQKIMASDEFIEEVKYLATPEEHGVTINFFTTGKECNNRLVTKIEHKIIIAFSGTKRRKVDRGLCATFLGKNALEISSSE